MRGHPNFEVNALKIFKIALINVYGTRCHDLPKNTKYQLKNIDLLDYPFKSGFRIRIRINLSCWIRIRIQIADPDPGGQK